MAPKSNESPRQKRTQRYREDYVKIEIRDWNDASSSQETTRIKEQPAEAWQDRWDNISLQASIKGTKTADTIT